MWVDGWVVQCQRVQWSLRVDEWVVVKCYHVLPLMVQYEFSLGAVPQMELQAYHWQFWQSVLQHRQVLLLLGPWKMRPWKMLVLLAG